MAEIGPAPIREALAALGPEASDAIVELLRSVSPSVVEVRRHGRGGGAGFVWDGDGGIVTNAHVVGDADRLEVRYAGGQVATASVVRRDANLDLALLEGPAGAASPVRIGDSAQLRAGQLVFAIGHPWGQVGVVTAGIVSAVRTVMVAGQATEDLIRSDVQLAPGNSGGPLLNPAGEVIGVNSMIWGGDLSISIPSNRIRAWLASSPERAEEGPEVVFVRLPAWRRQARGGWHRR
ncbi:MAG: trypsin-like peptidase domain-containing protein [Chloroflexi bacterium]|nr:trypsin-like peptidase domain-containing protein [Chloroflexota bacterium]